MWLSNHCSTLWLHLGIAPLLLCYPRHWDNGVPGIQVLGFNPTPQSHTHSVSWCYVEVHHVDKPIWPSKLLPGFWVHGNKITLMLLLLLLLLLPLLLVLPLSPTQALLQQLLLPLLLLLLLKISCTWLMIFYLTFPI